MPLIHCWQDILDQGENWLTPAETLLIEACKTGQPCGLDDHALPPEGPAAPNREIRADVLRYLILGGCEDKPVRGNGLHLMGGHVTGDLGLSFARAQGATQFINCRFDRPVIALQTRFELLALSSCALPGLNAEGAQVKGDVILDSITATGGVSLLGAGITGQLSCIGATFSATKRFALNAQGAQVKGGVFLDGITSTGEVSLSGADITGQLSCEGATFSATKGLALNAEGAQVKGGVFLGGIKATGEVSLSGADIAGVLDCTGATFSATKGDALNAQRLRVSEGLFWRNVKTPDGFIVFTSAHVGDLVDDTNCWPEAGRLILDGFTYDRIGGATTDAKTRIKWLEKGSISGTEFFPQPFTQMAKVLRAMGHELDAQKVLVKRDQLLGKYARRQSWQSSGVFGRLVFHPVRILFDWLYHYIAGYGHRPIFSFGWIIFLILIAGMFAHLAWNEGSFAPNSGPILVSQDWQDFAGLDGNPAELWSAKGAPGQDWETFYAGTWAADLVIPIIDLGQSDAWAPSTARGPWGRFLWWAQWVFILMGWVVTALGAAALTGVIRRD